MWIVEVFHLGGDKYSVSFSTPEGYAKGLIGTILLFLFLIVCGFLGLAYVSAYLAFPFCIVLVEILLKLMFGMNEDSRLPLALTLLPLRLYAWTSVIWTYERLSMAAENRDELGPFFGIAWFFVGMIYVAGSLILAMKEADNISESIAIGMSVLLVFLIIYLILYPSVFSSMSELPYNGFTEENFKFVRVLFRIFYIIAGIGLVVYLYLERSALLSSLPFDLLLTAVGIVPLLIIYLIKGAPTPVRAIILFLLYGILSVGFHKLKGKHYGRTICLLLPLFFCMICSFMHSAYASFPILPVQSMYNIHNFFTTSGFSQSMSNLVQPSMSSLCGIFSGITNAILKLYSLITENSVSKVHVPEAVAGTLGLVISVVVIGLGEIIAPKAPAKESA